MTEARQTVMFAIGLIFAVLAVGAVLGAYPRSFDGSGGGSWVAAPGAHLSAAVLAAVAAAHLWVSLSEAALARVAAGLVAGLGLVVAIVLTAALPPIGIVLVMAYGYVLLGIVRGQDHGEASELRHRLRRRGRGPS